MNKKVSIALLLLAVFAGLGYWFFDYLGGNNPIRIEKIDQKPPTLIGLTYEGTPQDEKLGQTFDRIENLLATQPGKKMYTIYEVEPAGKLDTMRVFVGFEGLPVDTLDYRVFDQSSYLLASIEANRWVMPGPLKVQQKIREFASKNELKLSGVYVDKILSEEKVQVMAPLN
ncbi:hypothetical protein [Algoriphagus namhaensis]